LLVMEPFFCVVGECSRSAHNPPLHPRHCWRANTASLRC
jgi:hypothetical protein